jgi:hypothetical protein
MPINYPEGMKIEAEQGKIYTFETSNPYDDVYKFIKSNLKLAPLTVDGYGVAIGTWREYSIRDNGALFKCGSRVKYNLSELGCIFVNKNNGGTVVYAMWSYNEGPGIPCYELPGLEAEDYLEVFDSGP